MTKPYTQNRKPSKYRNKKTKRLLPSGEPVEFDSKREAVRFDSLIVMAKQGHIKNLTLQPEYEIIPTVKWGTKTLRKIKYIADFRYEQNGKIVVEDVKGFHTKEYSLKKRLFLIQNPDVEFKEI